MNHANDSQLHSPLLGRHEPPAWQQVNCQAKSPLILLCDHASNRVPVALKQLGLGDLALEQHIAYDIGCAPLSHRLSTLFDATALLAGYSRLVIDLNRHPGDAASIPVVSDNIEIPGNRNLSPRQIILREGAIFWAYHNQIGRILERQQALGRDPVLCSIHSFTPVFRGFKRPWHIGVLWDRDQRLARSLLDRLSKIPEICSGDNEPYHAKKPVGYTMDIHGERRGFAHVLLEIRQDLIDSPAGVEQWASLIHKHLAQALSDSGFI